MKIITNLLFLVLLTMPLGLHAQADVPDKSSAGNKTRINVPVIVRDREGRRISGLKKEDFTLYRNGVQQNISSFATEDEPISVALLLDTSGSTQEVLNNIKNAAKDFIDLLNPKDQCMVATFDSQVDILSPFISDQEALKKSLDKIKTADKEGSVMLNAINQVAQSSFSRVEGRKAIVLLSDGKDYGSDISRKDLVSELEESEVSIYAIYYQSGTGFIKPIIDSSGTVSEGKPVSQPKNVKKPKKKKGVYSITIPLPGDTFNSEEIKLIDKPATTDAIESLKGLSDITTGRFYLSNDAELSKIFKQVAAELRQQYLLSFQSEGSAPNGAAQDITVKVNRPNVVVQARAKVRP